MYFKVGKFAFNNKKCILRLKDLYLIIGNIITNNKGL